MNFDDLKPKLRSKRDCYHAGVCAAWNLNEVGPMLPDLRLACAFPQSFEAGLEDGKLGIGCCEIPGGWKYVKTKTP